MLTIVSQASANNLRANKHTGTPHECSLLSVLPYVAAGKKKN
jgi:hypothetical protein